MLLPPFCMSRRSVATWASVVLISQLLTVPSFAAMSFTDTQGTPYATAINALEEKGVVQGYANGSFKPNSAINRAEFLKIALEGQSIALQNSDNCFPDVQSDWFAKYVCTAKSQGIVSGYPDGSFKPEQQVTFAEASKILALAYKQPIEQNSPDWYEPYARALEGSNAIPTSISKLDAPLTRGEMSEMIWRISEKKTDLPSKSYLNVKYKNLAIDLTSETPVTAKSCADIRAFAAEANRTNSNYYFGRGMLEDAVLAAPMAREGAMDKAANVAGAAMPTTGGGGNGDYARTNVQVEGVDEADIIKTDGTYVYLVRNQNRSTVEVVQVKPATSVKQVATIYLSSTPTTDSAYPSETAGQDMSAQELYVDSGKLIVIGQGSSPMLYPMPMMREGLMGKMANSVMPYPTWTQKTVVKIFDISTPASPSLERTLTFEGNSVSSRRIGNKLYLITQNPVWRYAGQGGIAPMAIDTATETTLLPTIEDSAKVSSGPVARCSDVVILPHIPSPQYVTVSVIPTNNLKTKVSSEVILGSADNVYSSLNNLYLAATQYQYNWDPQQPQSSEKTNVYRFAFTDTGVKMEAQGSVPGHILNQFAMDEMDSHFRIATTINGQWQSNGHSTPSTNNLYVLSSAMETVGSITDIAPGETIYSVRFMGKRAYMVTFKTVDPLFVIDLSSPRNPKILGKLKIPGYSDYLHPYDENHVIGFGKEVDESIDKDKVHSDNAVYYTAILGMKVSMFDVTDVEHPIELHKVVIGDRNTTSPLLQNHKALLFEKDRGLLAFPVMVTKADTQTVTDPNGYRPEPSPVFQGAYVYNVDLQKGFTLRGTITHYDDPSVFQKSGGYWYNGGRDIERITRVGDSLVTISQASVRTNSETTLKAQGAVELK